MSSYTALSSNRRLLDTLFTDLIREVKNEESRLSKALRERLERLSLIIFIFIFV
jgi:hypothetical protein